MAADGVKVSLDSNILVYAAHTDDPKHELAVAVLARAAHGNCVQPLQSLGECFNVLTRKRGFSPAAARMAVDGLRALFPVVVADEAVGDGPPGGLPDLVLGGSKRWRGHRRCEDRESP